MSVSFRRCQILDILRDMQKTTITPPAMTSTNNITITAPSAATIGIMEDDDEDAVPESSSVVDIPSDVELPGVVCEVASVPSVVGFVFRFYRLLEVGISMEIDVVTVSVISNVDDDKSFEIVLVAMEVASVVEMAIVVVDIVVAVAASMI